MRPETRTHSELWRESGPVSFGVMLGCSEASERCLSSLPFDRGPEGIFFLTTSLISKLVSPSCRSLSRLDQFFPVVNQHSIPELSLKPSGFDDSSMLLL